MSMQIYAWIFLLIVIDEVSKVETTRTALTFLTRQPAPETHQFLESLAQDAIRYDIDVFAIIDDNTVNISSLHTELPHLQLIQIDNEKCFQSGYQKTTSLGPGWLKVTAWDKALLYFTNMNKNYSYVWLVEDDVFIPSSRAFLALHELYGNVSDLVIPRHEKNFIGDTSVWLWSLTLGYFSLPWSCSMVNIVGMSRRMLDAIDDYVRWRGLVPFHEFFFNTLAWQLNYTMITPPELNHIVYRDIYSFEQIEQLPNNLWHPEKNFTLQNFWREQLANQTFSQHFTINITDLQSLCHGNTSINATETYLNEFFTQLNVFKTRFSPAQRRSLRQKLSETLNRCKQMNSPLKITSLLKKLMNSAFKLPERSIEKKTSINLTLENQLKANKEKIFQLTSNGTRYSSEIHQLREEAFNLTLRLTHEIQRELEQEENQTSTESTLLRILTTKVNETTVQTTLPEIIETSTKIKIRISFDLSKSNWNQFGEVSFEEVKMFAVYLLISSVLLLILWWKDADFTKYLLLLSILFLFIIYYYLR